MRDTPHTPQSPLTVCVTGASGFVASHVVRELLGRGHTVRATVRDASDTARTAHLTRMAEAAGAVDRLTFHRADLLEPGSFDAAVSGCEVVCHTAAVARLSARDPQRDIVDPSVLGCQNVLGAIRRAGSVRRVVHTSSIAAILRYRDAPTHVFDERDWNTESTLAGDPYGLAKTQAEREMWRARGDDSAPAFELVTINPGVVFGEVYTRVHLRGSSNFVSAMLSGQYPGIPPVPLAAVDARDVAEAHANAVERPGVSGRFVLVADVMWMRDIAAVLARHCPDARVPKRALPTAVLYAAALFDKRMSIANLRRVVNNPTRFDNRRSREELGIAYRPLADAVRDAARSMLDGGFVRLKGR